MAAYLNPIINVVSAAGSAMLENPGSAALYTGAAAAIGGLAWGGSSLYGRVTRLLSRAEGSMRSVEGAVARASEAITHTAVTTQRLSERVRTALGLQEPEEIVDSDEDDEELVDDVIEGDGAVSFFRTLVRYAPKEHTPRVIQWGMIQLQNVLSLFPTDRALPPDAGLIIGQARRAIEGEGAVSPVLERVSALSRRVHLGHEPAPHRSRTFHMRLEDAKRVLDGPKPDETQPLHVLQKRTDEASKELGEASVFYMIYHLVHSILLPGESLQREYLKAAREATDPAHFDRLCTERGIDRMKANSFSEVYREVLGSPKEKRTEAFVNRMKQIINDCSQASFFPKLFLRWFLGSTTNLVQTFTNEFITGTLKSLRQTFDYMRAHPTFELDPEFFIHSTGAFQTMLNIMRDFAYGRPEGAFKKFFSEALEKPENSKGMSISEMFNKFSGKMITEFLPKFQWTKTVFSWVQSITEWAKSSSSAFMYYFKFAMVIPTQVLLYIINYLFVFPIQWISEKVKILIMNWMVEYFEVTKVIHNSLLFTFFGEGKYSTLTYAMKKVVLDVLQLIIKNLSKQTSSDIEKIDTSKYDEVKEAIKNFVVHALEIMSARKFTTQKELKTFFERGSGSLQDQIKELAMPEAVNSIMFLLLDIFHSFLKRENNEVLLHDGMKAVIDGLKKSDDISLDYSKHFRRKEEHKKLSQDIDRTLDNLLAVSVDLTFRNVFLSFGKEHSVIVEDYIRKVKEIFLGGSEDVEEEKIGDIAFVKAAIATRDPKEIYEARKRIIETISRLQEMYSTLESKFKSSFPEKIKALKELIVAKLETLSRQLDAIYNSVYFSSMNDVYSRYASAMQKGKESMLLAFRKLGEQIERNEESLPTLVLVDAALRSSQDVNEQIKGMEDLPSQVVAFTQSFDDNAIRFQQSLEILRRFLLLNYYETALSLPFTSLHPKIQERLGSCSDAYRKRTSLSFFGYIQEVKRRDFQENATWLHSPERKTAMSDFIAATKAMLPDDSIHRFVTVSHYGGRPTNVGIIPRIFESRNQKEFDTAMREFRRAFQHVIEKHQARFEEEMETIKAELANEEGTYVGTIDQFIRVVRDTKDPAVNEDEIAAVEGDMLADLDDFQTKLEEVDGIAPPSPLFRRLASHPFLDETIKPELHRFFVGLVKNLLELIPDAAPLLLRHCVIYPVIEK